MSTNPILACALALTLVLASPTAALAEGGPGTGDPYVAVDNYVQKGTTITLKRGVWVRDMPTTEGKKLQWLAPGAKLTFLEDVGHWAKIRWKKGEAYIPRLDFVLRKPPRSK